MRISDWSSDVCSSDLKTLVVRGPDQGRQCAWNDIGQHRARLKIAHPRLETLGPVVVHGEGEIPPVRADRNRAQAEIFLPLCKGGSDRKSTRRTPVTTAPLVCRLLLEQQKHHTLLSPFTYK